MPAQFTRPGPPGAGLGSGAGTWHWKGPPMSELSPVLHRGREERLREVRERPKVAQQVWVRLLLGPRAPDSQASDLAPQKMLASWLAPPLPQLLLTPALLGKVALDT